MAIEKELLYNKIIEAFPDAKINIFELVNDNDHYSLEIKSKKFIGKSRIEQHKMVNSALKDCLGTSLHALQIKTIIED